ncbi:coil containing protein [Vibrio phage 1.204.O._10N.222.46.F12]|uniref:Coil containing protein n=1 Tax=Vibrio phage 1.204.O._10N.222.46.F12 TaxID=1881263 RepID=A0A2I7RNP7_9CAUD|nr:coil containing protein [Vibrio phage 1.204.O._10N.222.46.F12]AUR95264.1 coil containing protein [Vibrio phage 1.204.O._10N.222.46.F12]
MSTVQLTLIARATAFAGTAEEKHFEEEVPADCTNLGPICDQVEAKARSYEAENAQTALFAQVEQANGKKLTKPQRELLILALSLQAGTHEPVEQSTETPPTDSNPEEQTETTSDSVEQTATETTSKESTEEVQSDGVDDSTESTEEPEQQEEQSADELVQEAAQEAEKATGSDTDAGVEAALAALGL